MASLGMGFGGAAAGNRRVFAAAAAATATKSAGGSTSSVTEEKGLLDFILGSLQKEDQLLEIDPILKKVENKNNNGTIQIQSTTSVSIPNNKKKSGGGSVFGGLFAKK